MFSERVTNCYDSHVHWLATGELSGQLKLHDLKSPSDVKSLKVQPQHFRGEWLLGFGWNQNGWAKSEFPHRSELDEAFGPDVPVAFARADGHAHWVSTAALKRAGLFDQPVSDPPGGRILRDSEGRPTGVLIDKAEKILDVHIPKRTAADAKRALLRGMQIFNQAGFTHIRDLTCDEIQWSEAVKLEYSGLLTLAVEQYFSVEEGMDFSVALDMAEAAKKIPTRRLRVKGIKVFVDGALGSEGAWLSHEYSSGTGHGLRLLDMAELKEIMIESWRRDLDLAVHVIGDEAAHQTLLTFDEVHKRGISGRLHLEHAELLRGETIELMRGRQVRAHMQPCHWLTDHHWLEEKIGALKQHAFPWRALQEAQVPFDFGSDSPIERPSVADNIRALDESAGQGIGRLLGDPLIYHSHPDSAWVPNTYSIFADGIPTEIVFAGEHIL
jgi:predicted amidohydrolase YtcJ